MATYQITLRDRETQTVVGYYNGAWTTDPRRALALGRREAAEAHAARMRDRCPRNTDLIKVEDCGRRIRLFTTRYALICRRAEWLSGRAQILGPV